MLLLNLYCPLLNLLHWPVT